MFQVLGDLLKLILWPIGTLLEWIVTGLIKLFTWGVDAVIKLGDKLAGGITDKRIPLPKDAPREEISRRLGENLEIILHAIYVPDQKLEDLLGCSLTDKDPQVRSGLSYEQLLYCDQQLERYIQAAGKFGETYMPMVSEMCHDYVERQILSKAGKRLKKRWFDDSAASLKTIKKLWNKTLGETKPDTKEKCLSADALEESVRNRVKLFAPILKNTFASCYQLLLTVHLNFHSTWATLYDLE